MKKHMMIFGLVLQMILLCLPACAEKNQANEAWSYMPKEAYAAPAYLLVGQDNLFCVNPHMGMVLNWEGRMNTLSYPYVRDGKISTEAFVNQMMRMLRMMLME